MRIGDPFKFSVMIEPIEEWCGNSAKPWSGGVMIITVDGFMFPDSEVLNIALDCMIPELINDLKQIPVNKDVFDLKDKRSAFGDIYNIVHPENGENEDWRYVISPQEIWDKDHYIFAVSDGESVRLLAAKPEYDAETSRHGLHEITVRETFVSLAEVSEMIECLEDLVRQMKERSRE